MLRVAREIGLPGVCSQGRLDSADSELQRPVTHCSTAELEIAQLTLITDNKQMCLRLASVLCHDFIQTQVRRSFVTKSASGDVTHMAAYL